MGNKHQKVITSSQREESNTPKRHFVIGIIGDSKVGKTAFIHKVLTDTFLDTYSPTLDIISSELSYESYNETFTIELRDFPGNEKNRTLSLPSLSDCDAVIILYDITNKQSVKLIDKLVKAIHSNCNSEIPFEIYGTKVDLRDYKNKEQNKNEDKATECLSKYGIENNRIAIKSRCFTVKKIYLKLVEKLVDIQMKKEKKTRLNKKESQFYEIYITGDENDSTRNSMIEYYSTNEDRMKKEELSYPSRYIVRQINGNDFYLTFQFGYFESRYINLSTFYISLSDLVILIFQMNRNSFETTKKSVELVLSFKENKKQMLFIVNKSDTLLDISEDEIKQYANKYNIKCFFDYFNTQPTLIENIIISYIHSVFYQ